MLRTFFAAVLLAAASSLAQSGDEWSTFPPSQPADAPPTPKEPPPVEPVIDEEPPDAGTASPDESLDGGDDDTRLLSRTETWLPGSEPHSPSTWGHSWDAKANDRVSVGQAGLGTVFVPTARMGAAGVVRVSVLGEFLDLPDFPVLNGRTLRSGITFGASFQPFRWGEVFVSYGAAVNSSSRTSPNLISSLGDLQFGIKLSNEWAKGFHAGIDLRLLTFSGVGNQGVDRFAFGFKPTLLVTWDVRELTPYVPLLLTAGFGATLDSTGGLVSNQVLNASEEFALNTNQYQRLNVMASAEIPFPVVTPFVEWQIAPVLGVPGGELVGPDGIYVSAAEAIRHTIGAGIKLTPIKDLTLLSGFNFGLARRVGLGIPATPPWNFFVGASFAIDPFQHGEKKLVVEVREKETEVVKAPPALRLEGVITDAETKAPLPGVIVAIAGNKPTASGSDGAYESLPVTGDKVTVSVSREGYKSIEQEFAVDADGPTKVDLELVPDVKKAEFLVSTTSKSKPVKAAISFQGAEEARGETGEGDGKASFELVAGVYTVTAIADGYLAKTRDVQVSPGGTLNLDFELEAVPKKVLVIFKGDKIEILQQVHFATGKATILPDSHGLLAQVVDAIIKNDVKRVRVDGHTDNKGKKDFNQQLSEDRAQAVKDYLIKQGLDANRLEAAGYGDSKPVAPNLTARGRELNRRVEFIVLER